MYEQFGVRVDRKTGVARFRLFLPDAERCPSQVRIGGQPHIAELGVVGDFQGWDFDRPIPMERKDYVDPHDGQLKGWLYEATVADLEHGFYQYKYVVTFENTERRIVSDPCARYGGTENQNSAFVVGGVPSHAQTYRHKRRPLSELAIYEMMIDDFTACIDARDECPMQRVLHRLKKLKELGIDAIEFMPWTTNMRSDVPGPDGFSWGYDPIQYFSVDHRYTNDPVDECRKLTHVKNLVNACHELDIHVILDVVCNHADAADPNRGFPYYWLYQDPNDCPYVGDFAAHAFFRDLEYSNRCTMEYMRDSLLYWVDEFAVDGFWFDNTLGLYDPNDPSDGLPSLIEELREHLARRHERNFSIILEHSWDYDAIDVVNRLDATSCWLDPFRSRSMEFIGSGQIEPTIMRMLDSGRDFAEGRCPTIYLENHDHRRLLRAAGGRERWFLSQPYIMALFTCAGAPMIYNGQEYGPDDDMPEDGPGRVVPRPLDWVALESEVGQSVFQRYRQMIAIRAAHPALRGLEFYPRGWDDGWTEMNEHGFGIDRGRQVVVYHRWDEAEELYIALNLGRQSQPVSFEVPHAGPWVDLISGTTYFPAGGKLDAEIGADWGAIFWAPVDSSQLEASSAPTDIDRSS